MESYREKSFLTGKEVLVMTPGHETKKNDPKYGVANQETIRAKWKQMTGEDIP